jgi:hypothetical protein
MPDANTADVADGDAIHAGDASSDADADAPDAAASPEPQLIHRYDFSGEGTEVLDLVGDAHGTLMQGAALDGNGGAELDGVAHYVNLPNGLVSHLPSLSVVAWLEWHGVLGIGRGCWQRIFDFGSNGAGEDQSGIEQVRSLFLTPYSCNNGVLLLMYEDGVTQQAILAPGPLPSGELVQVAAVLDGEASHAILYVNGVAVESGALARSVSEEADINDWLGRSQWIQDTDLLYARYDEFRIYVGVLGEERVAELYEQGPDDP